MVFLIASHNHKKAVEMMAILTRRFPNIEIGTLVDFPSAPEPEETGTTYAENARIKAVSASLATGMLSIADDAGLEIDALGGDPGLYSKRYAGEETPFSQKMEIILNRMEETPESDRTARFRCAVCIAWKNKAGEIVYNDFEAICEGRIATAPSGNGGFGYDQIFFLPELNCTMADLTADQKHSISHRGKVLKLAGDWLASSKLLS